MSEPCEICGFSLGEGYVYRSLQIHKLVICGKCAQQLPGSAYQAWLKESRGVREV